MIKPRRVTVAIAAPVEVAVGRRWGQSIDVRAPGGDIELVEDGAAVVGSGYVLPAGEVVRVTLQPGERLWAIGPGAADVEAHVLEQGAA